MVSFARARTKSWLTRLWPSSVHSFQSKTIQLDESSELLENQSRHNKRFLELIKNGGMWSS